MSDKQREIVGLQFLRGLAAVAVVVDHTAGLVEIDRRFVGPRLNLSLVGGAAGVDIFFVISGFIIAAVSLAPGDLVPKVTVKDFFLRRFSRIVPLMWLAILAYGGLRWLSVGEVPGWEYVNALLLLPVGGVQPPIIWTLRNEAVFYAVFALTFLASRRARWAMAAWCLAPLLVAAFLSDLSFGPLGDLISNVFSSVNFEFAAGLLIGLWYLRRNGLPSVRLPLHPLIVLALLVAVLAASGIVDPMSWRTVGRKAELTVLSGAILLVAIVAACPKGGLTAFGEMIGNASYSIYLFHLIFVSGILKAWARLAPATPAALVISATIIAATALAVLVHLYVEKPLVRSVQFRTLPARQPSQPAADHAILVEDVPKG